MDSFYVNIHLSGGDDSGLLTDDRHFGGNDFRTKGSVVRGAVNFGWYLFRTNQMLYAEKVLTTALTHLSETDGKNRSNDDIHGPILLRAHPPDV